MEKREFISLKSNMASALIVMLIAGLSPLPALAVRLAGQNVFEITSGAGGITASKRTQVAQHNLDDALVASNDRSSSAVNVVEVKGTPVVTLGGYSVVTVDAGSAKLAHTTPALLAKRWADGIRAALRNQSNVKAYIAQLTNSSPSAGGPVAGSGSIGATSNPLVVQKARVVYIPAGMTMSIALMGAISSQAAQAGDPVRAQLAEDVNLGNSVIPAGSIISGRVVEAKSGQRLSKSGTLTIKFDNLRTPDGASSRIQAHLIADSNKMQQTVEGDQIKGETTSSKIKTAAVHGAIGAGAGVLLGTVIGAISSHGYGTGRGALSGLAIGAGLGVAESLLLRKGQDAVLPSGEHLQLQLDAPATIATSTTGNM